MDDACQTSKLRLQIDTHPIERSWPPCLGALVAGRSAAIGTSNPNHVQGNLMKPEYILEGRRTTTLAAFYAEVGQVLLAGQPWGENLDALHDLLRGDYGLLPETFRLVWRDAQVAQAALGYPETVHQLTRRLRDCQPTSLIKTAWALRAALREQGPTVYDWLVDLMGKHPNVELVLAESEEAIEA